VRKAGELASTAVNEWVAVKIQALIAKTMTANGKIMDVATEARQDKREHRLRHV
jgi:uncharacterized protein YoaH (UPF0181 family)